MNHRSLIDPKIVHAFIALTLAEKGMDNALAQFRAAQAGLGRAFRDAREAKGISLRAVAKAIGCSAPFVSDCELGRRNFSDKLANEAEEDMDARRKHRNVALGSMGVSTVSWLLMLIGN